MTLPAWVHERLDVPPGSAIERALLGWRHEIRAAVEKHDPSKLALRLVHEGAPPELRDFLYKVIVSAPWRDAVHHRRRTLSAVDEIGVVSLYTMLAGGFLLLNRRRQKRDQILDHISHRYGGISKRMIERVLQKHGASVPKPPRVLTPKTRR